MSTCRECGREYEYDRSKGHRKTLCNSCNTNKRRFTIKEKIVEYLGGKCQRCTYSACIQALDVHHLDATQKEFTLAGSHNRSWENIQAELDKCVLICANCHREEHCSKQC